MSKIISEEMLITPAIAAEFLEHNKCNRQISQSVVDKYADQMLQGKWLVTHQGIAIDENGNLQDGQHRLLAIIKSGVSIKMIVFENTDPEAFGVIDGHLVRNKGHIAHIRGVANASEATTIASAMIAGMTRVTWDKNDVVEFTVVFDDIIQPVIHHLHGVPCATAAVKAAFANAARAYGLAKIEPIMELFKANLFNDEKHPIRRLISFLTENTIRMARRGMRLRGDMVYAYTCSAINATLENRKLVLLKPVEKDFPYEYFEPKRPVKYKKAKK